MAVFRVEKSRDYTVMSNYHLRDKNLTLKSKGLLSMMLSLPDEWNYTTRGLAAICKEGVDSIGASLRELESAGYIIRRRLRDEKGKITDTEYTIYERPQKPDTGKSNMQQPDTGKPNTQQPDTRQPYTEKPYMDKQDTVEPCTDNPAQLNTNKTNTKKINIHELNIHQSIHSEPDVSLPCSNIKPDWMDKIDMIEKYRRLIMENVEYSFLIDQYGSERMDELVELMLETVLSKRDYIRIAGDDFPREVVKSRMLKINSSHVEYVFDCIDKNTTKVHNIKAYLITALYNAPATMDSYYRAEVNHDLYGRGSV